MFVKGKVDFGHIQIWGWVRLSKENLTLDSFDSDAIPIPHQIIK
jgi:hypothetical protein